MKRKAPGRRAGGEETGERAAELDVMSQRCNPLKLYQLPDHHLINIRTKTKHIDTHNVQFLKWKMFKLSIRLSSRVNVTRQIHCCCYSSPAERASGSEILQDYLHLLNLILQPLVVGSDDLDQMNSTVFRVLHRLASEKTQLKVHSAE
ncbi:hypothetical protein F2P81_007358 [Scophthalmus maximus]|uniref:Uncharacterized protein n=1 Tax=Scophthalmus maximus TaxID=52904 RepID=A0A6A4TCB7_SCOMX|nr:hypothetical protein F2P81_007358 [Scophthalmus maximus]